MRRWLPALILMACSAPPTSTSPPSLPSTSATVGTTTSVATTAEVSTSTTGPASLSFIVSFSGLIGYWDGEHWTPSDLDSPVVGGEDYQIIDLDGLVGESVGSEVTICEPAGTPLVELDPPLLVTNDEPGEVAVANANWNLTPRPTDQTEEPPADLVAEGVAFIEARGLTDPAPHVAQYLTFDLEGDGSIEEVLVLNRLPAGLIGNDDSYSLMLMRKQLDVEQTTLVVAYSQGEADSPYVVSYFVTAIADLNGDDKMELVVDGHYYEGNATYLHEYKNDDLGLVEVLATGCGA